MFDPEKEVVVGRSALEHGLEAGYIEEMWRNVDVEGFEVERLPPRETNVIVVRFVSQPGGILEMIAEEGHEAYFVFHAQLVPEGGRTALLHEALELYFGM